MMREELDLSLNELVEALEAGRVFTLEGRRLMAIDGVPGTFVQLTMPRKVTEIFPGWIKHEGTRFPDVSTNGMLIAKRRDGKLLEGNAANFRWSHIGASTDIVMYKTVENQQTGDIEMAEVLFESKNFLMKALEAGVSFRLGPFEIYEDCGIRAMLIDPPNYRLNISDGWHTRPKVPDCNDNVKVLLRDGSTIMSTTSKLNWSLIGSPNDIIMWKYIR